jgi:hypothetical protein
MDDALLTQDVQASPEVAMQARWQLEVFLQPLLVLLDQQLDARLVRTLVHTVVALVQWRNRAQGLLLSELGAYLLSPAHAPAGTKRLSNLLRSTKWAAADITAYLWQRADTRLEELAATDEEALVIWDSSVLEKPESLASPDLGSVRSSKARRLTRIKPGYYSPPSRPIFVPSSPGGIGLVCCCSGATGKVALLRWRPCAGGRIADRIRATDGQKNSSCSFRWRGGGAGASAMSGIVASLAPPGSRKRWRATCASWSAGRDAIGS